MAGNLLSHIDCVKFKYAQICTGSFVFNACLFMVVDGAFSRCYSVLPNQKQKNALAYINCAISVWHTAGRKLFMAYGGSTQTLYNNISNNKKWCVFCITIDVRRGSKLL